MRGWRGKSGDAKLICAALWDFFFFLLSVGAGRASRVGSGIPACGFSRGESLQPHDAYRVAAIEYPPAGRGVGTR